MATEKPKILIQLDVDPQPSVFDGVVAVDSGVDHLFRHGGVTPAVVRDLVHGALFTRGPAELCSTAIFVGGSDVAAAEAVLDAVKKTFFGPFKVSVLFDANGSLTGESYVRRIDKFLAELVWMAKVLRHGRENISLE